MKRASQPMAIISPTVRQNKTPRLVVSSTTRSVPSRAVWFAITKNKETQTTLENTSLEERKSSCPTAAEEKVEDPLKGTAVVPPIYLSIRDRKLIQSTVSPGRSTVQMRTLVIRTQSWRTEVATQVTEQDF